jgi:hypothetical protein
MAKNNHCYSISISRSIGDQVESRRQCCSTAKPSQAGQQHMVLIWKWNYSMTLKGRAESTEARAAFGQLGYRLPASNTKQKTLLFLQ